MYAVKITMVHTILSYIKNRPRFSPHIQSQSANRTNRDIRVDVRQHCYHPTKDKPRAEIDVSHFKLAMSYLIV